MAAEIIDGKAIAGRVRITVARDVEAFGAQFGGARPASRRSSSATTPAPRSTSPASRRPARRSAWTGFDHPLPADTPREEVVALIERLNADDAVSGILLQLPLPDISTASS